jgi:hypothetical protein
MREHFASTRAVDEHQLGRVLINAQIAAPLLWAIHIGCPKNCTRSYRRSAIIQTRGHPCADPRLSYRLGRGYTPTLIRPDNERVQRGAKFVTSRAEEYQGYARQCVEIAPTFQDEQARATLLGFAHAWSRLAHLTLANRQIAELTVQIARQRVIVKYELDTGQRSEMAESQLDALEGSLRIFEKHRLRRPWVGMASFVFHARRQLLANAAIAASRGAA